MLRCEKSTFNSLKQLKKENKSFKIYQTGTATLKTDKKTDLPQFSWRKSGNGIACQNGAQSG